MYDLLAESIPLLRNESKELPFSLSLPSTLWSSFVVPNAYTWYGLKLTGRSGSQHGRKETLILKRDVVILGQVNLPPEPQPFKKIQAAADGGLKLEVRLSQTHCLAGGQFPFKLKLYTDNSSKYAGAGVKATLQQNVKYNFHSRHRGMAMRSSYARIIWEKEKESDGEIFVWEDAVDVPYVVPTGLGSEPCTHFQVLLNCTFSSDKFK